MTIIACPWKCGGVVNTAIANWCSLCGRDLARTYKPIDNDDPEPRFGYGDPDRCALRTNPMGGGTDSWGCHKIAGHRTGRGGRHCSTHICCGYRSPDGINCGYDPGHDDGIHERESVPSGELPQGAKP